MKGEMLPCGRFCQNSVEALAPSVTRSYKRHKPIRSPDAF